MKDFRKEWFYNQHFSQEELEQLYEWCQKGGYEVDIKQASGK